MKAKNFLIAIICCLTLQINAQDNTIVNDRNSWATLHYGLGAFMIPCDVSTEYVYFDGDSLTGEQSYKKVFSCDDSLRENVEYKGLMREQYKKTYFIPKDSTTEYLLYDFSLEKGMSFECTEYRWQQSVNLYVKEVDSVEINGFMKKRIQFSIDSTSEQIVDTWIENLGNLDDFLYPMNKLIISGSVSNLLCFFQNEELTYKNPRYAKCYYDNAEELPASTQITVVENCNVFPNPVHDILTIACSGKTVSRIEIFNISGEKVYTQTNAEPISMSSFSKGLYLLKIYDNNGQISTYKIIKK